MNIVKKKIAFPLASRINLENWVLLEIHIFFSVYYKVKNTLYTRSKADLFWTKPRGKSWGVGLRAGHR